MEAVPTKDMEREMRRTGVAFVKDGRVIPKEKLYLTQETNREGKYVPAIFEPFYIAGVLKKCECGKVFVTREGYRKHYAYEHIYKYCKK